MGLRKDVWNHRLLTILSAWLIPVAVIGISGLFALGGDEVRDWLRFDRGLIDAGQYWRLVSGHFVHLGVSHFLLNSCGLLLVWYLVGQHLSAANWLFIAAASILVMDIGFWLFEPQLYWYVGLSGLLHGILAAGIVAALRHDRTMALILATLVIVKLAYEQLLGPLPGSEASSGGSVVVVAHLYGAIGGVVAAVVLLRTSQRPDQQTS